VALNTPLTGFAPQFREHLLDQQVALFHEVAEGAREEHPDEAGVSGMPCGAGVGGVSHGAGLTAVA
jgi:hypothetical protein